VYASIICKKEKRRKRKKNTLNSPEKMSPVGSLVAVYRTIGLPPSLTGALNDTIASALPGKGRKGKGMKEGKEKGMNEK
jgi:hypothetical protein